MSGLGVGGIHGESKYLRVWPAQFDALHHGGYCSIVAKIPPTEMIQKTNFL